jgi:hypothetical protein
MAECGESDGAGVADRGEHGRRRRAANRGRHSEGSETKSPLPGMETVRVQDVRCAHGMVLLWRATPLREGGSKSVV